MQRHEVAEIFEEIKQFSYQHFDEFDADHNGFLTYEELEATFEREQLACRECTFVCFLVRRLDDIEDAYQEEWAGEAHGISRPDIQEYFAAIQRTLQCQCQSFDRLAA